MNSAVIPRNNFTTPIYTSKQVRNPYFEGPGILRNSPLFGNHLAASRPIERGDVIYEEASILEFPDYGSTHSEAQTKSICLNCYANTKKNSEKCARCFWPLCQNGLCQNAGPHEEMECQILSVKKIPCHGTPLDYTSIEMLRCLLLQKTKPSTWKTLLDLEPHLLARKNDWKAAQDLKYLTDFIQNKCGLAEYDESIIARMAGVTAINKFGVHNYLQDRSSAYLFDRLSFLLHDCNPNSQKEYVERQPEVRNGLTVCTRQMTLRIVATKAIFPGEPITIDYLGQKSSNSNKNLSWNVGQRRNTLAEEFYFECRCQRCLDEMNSNRSS